MARFSTVGLTIVLCAFSAAVTLKRQAPPGTVYDFKTEYNKVSLLVLQQQIDAYRCFSKLYFQDSSPMLNLDVGAPTGGGGDVTTTAAPAPTEPPVVTPAPTAAPPARSVNERQYQPPNQQYYLLPWQVDVINRLIDRYYTALSETGNCEKRLSHQQPQ